MLITKSVFWPSPKMQINVTSDKKAFTKKLGLLKRRHIPKATNDAINKTLFGLRKEMMKQTSKKLDRPIAFTQKGFLVNQSKVNKLIGRLFIKPVVAQYLGFQIDGGVRQGTPNIAVPYTKNVRLNKFGNVSGRKRGLIKNDKQFIATIKGVSGVYQRMANNKVKLLYGFEKTATYTPRFPFFRIGKGYIKSKFRKNMKEKLNQEIKGGSALF